MKVDYLRKPWEDASAEVRKAFFKQIKFLERDLHHRSLRAKKYDESQNLWQVRVNKTWRFYFHIVRDTYLIPHSK
jgi:plasmid maintenance system killer protein